MEFIFSILISAGAFHVGAKLLDGVTIDDFKQAILVALLVAFLNATLGIALQVLTLGILSSGIFHLVLSAIIIKVADYFLDGLKVRNFWWALGLAATVSIFLSLFNWVF